MPIVPSRAGRIQELLARLDSEDPRERDSAVAGLTLAGPRAIEPLSRVLAGGGRFARLGGLEVLDRLQDRRALPAVLSLVEDADGAVAGRAIEVAGASGDPRAIGALRAVLCGPAAATRGLLAVEALHRLLASGLVEALDPLAACLLDESAPARLRLRILDRLVAAEGRRGRASLRPLLTRARSSDDPAVAARAAAFLSAEPEGRRRREEAGTGSDASTARLLASLERASDPRRVAALARALAASGGPAPIPALVRALERLGSSRGASRESASARAEIHLALAALDSRVAVFDLRESIEGRLPGAMPRLLEAAGRVGDARLVPPLVAAVVGDPDLGPAAARALGAIVSRERLRRSHARVKAVPPEHRAVLDALWPRRGRGAAG